MFSIEQKDDRNLSELFLQESMTYAPHKKSVLFLTKFALKYLALIALNSWDLDDRLELGSNQPYTLFVWRPATRRLAFCRSLLVGLF